MKPTLLIATMSLAFASPAAFAKSELETLRLLCQEQRRQINELEAANERLKADGRESQASPSKTPTAGKSPASPSTSSSTYTVKAGDNIEKIARKVGSSPDKLAKSNGLKTSSIIRPGQKLKVSGSTAPGVQSSKSSRRTHKVESGDTMFSISKKHGVSTEALVAANPNLEPSSLQPGQLVRIGSETSATTLISTQARTSTRPTAEKSSNPSVPSVAKTSQTRENTAASTSLAQPTPEIKSETATARTPVAESATPAAAPQKKIRPVTIEGETTYGEFASLHGTNAERLNALNGLDLTTATVLAKGSELYVPAQP